MIKHDVEQPKITDHDVLIRVKMAGVNPIDNTTVSGTREIKPLPHIPGGGDKRRGRRMRTTCEELKER